jgi:hypothetical protein
MATLGRTGQLLSKQGGLIQAQRDTRRGSEGVDFHTGWRDAALSAPHAFIVGCVILATLDHGTKIRGQHSSSGCRRGWINLHFSGG